MSEHDENEDARSRRREDNPDWKQVTPRWLLVLIAGAGVWLGYSNLRAIVLRVEATTAKLSIVERRQNEGDMDRGRLAVQIAVGRVDSLRWQEFQLAQRGPSEFLSDTRNRLRDAENELGRLKRQPGFNNYGGDEVRP